VRHPDCATLREADLSSVESQAFYPLTFPITAGPGCIVVMITLSAQASAQRDLRIWKRMAVSRSPSRR
jgi:small neutral amino acid transporter SnatA (MarC family)